MERERQQRQEQAAALKARQQRLNGAFTAAFATAAVASEAAAAEAAKQRKEQVRGQGKGGVGTRLPRRACDRGHAGGDRGDWALPTHGCNTDPAASN